MLLLPSCPQVPPLLFSPEYEEADTFSLFESLMEAVGPWYITQGKSNGGRQRCWQCSEEASLLTGAWSKKFG